MVLMLEKGKMDIVNGELLPGKNSLKKFACEKHNYKGQSSA